jgi:gluconolactonase
VSRLLLSLCSLLLTIWIAAATATAAELGDLVAGPVEKVVGDCRFTEGPAWHPAGFLLFTDIPNNRIIKVNPDGTSSDWMTDTQGANGLMCDQEGNVYSAQGGARRLARLQFTIAGEGEVAAVLAERFEEQPFNQPNDLAIDSEGGVYFTDPNYRQEPLTQPVEGVYYVNGEGEVSRVVGDLPRPNGVIVSQDGKTLYVANINERKVMAYPIVAPGQLSEGKVIFEGDEELDGGGPDGMSVDAEGNLYCTYKQLVVLTATGELIGRVEIPEQPANCAFGGEDNQTLYVTARTSLYRIPMKVAGIPLRQQGPQGTAIALADGDPAPTDEPSPEDEPATEEELPETVEVALEGLTLQVPTTWEKQKPTSNLRLGQFAIPPLEGDADPGELAIFPPFGGTVQANVERWIGQFDGAGREVKATQGECPQGKYVFVELTGTYKKPVGPPVLQQTEAVENYKMLGIILMTEDAGNFFLKLTAPKATAADVADDLRRAIGAEAEKETAYEL